MPRIFKYTVVFILTDANKTVLSIPNYDFRWQLAYNLETPLKLPAGSKMVITAHYDNSRNNKYNPAPEKEVYFRAQNQSWDEMFTPFIQYTIDNQDLTTQPAQPLGPHAEDALQIAEAVGCLAQDSSSAWTLTRAGDPVMSMTPSMTSVAIKSCERQSP